MKRRRIARAVATAAYVLFVTYFMGKCAIYSAYLERGYMAYGGEYLLILVMAWVAYKVISNFFDALEETSCAKNGEIWKKSTRSKTKAP